MSRAILVLAALALTSCATTLPMPTPATTTPPAAASSGCQVRGSGEMVMPDPACTPGAVNPVVTPATVASTICKAGWTATVRPSESYTEPIKVQDIAAYGDYAGSSTSAYELDHLIPLELGGSPTDPRNLWPEFDAGHIPNPKDSVESAARRAACADPNRLPELQMKMAANWIELGDELR